MGEIDDYIKEEKLDKLIDFSYDWKEPGLFGTVDGKFDTPFPPDKQDLVNLHRAVRKGKITTILEFGSGFSTVVMADALFKNWQDYEIFETLEGGPSLRNNHKFRLHSVEASLEWAAKVIPSIPEFLQSTVTIKHSTARTTTHNGELCCMHETLPDIVPDFIYLDGPHPKDVKRNHRGLSFHCDERTILAADILLYESTLIPGATIWIDGRVNNARFLARNLKRTWDIREVSHLDITTMKLSEPRLGKVNTYWWEVK